MSGHVSTPVAWREIAQLSRDCLGIQVGDVFVYVDQSLADNIGRPPERVVGSEPEALLERAQSPATGRDGDAATPTESSLPRETVADAIAAARTEGFWTGHLRAATGTGSAGSGPGDTRERRPVGFEVTITATGNGELVWRSPAVEGTPEAVDHESDRDRSGPGDEAPADGDPVAAADPLSLEFETLDVLGVAAAVLDEKRRVRGWNDRFADVTGYPPETLDGLPVEALFTETTPAIPGLLTSVPDGDSDPVVGELLTADGESRRHEFSVAPFGPPTTEGRFRYLLGRDIAARSDQSSDLRTLHDITELLLETTQELLAAADRDAMERILCTRLVDSDHYRFAWVGERATDSARLVVRRSADDCGPLEQVPIGSEDDDTRAGVAARALDTGEVEVATTAEDPTFEPWRAGTSDREFETVAAVPLQYCDTTFGVLVVSTTRSEAFGDRERDAFAVLGATVGLAIHAERNFELLRTDRVVELEFDVSVVDTVCAATAAELDCNLSLEGYVPAGDHWILYLSVDGAAPTAVSERLAGDSRVDRTRVIRQSGRGGRLEVVVPEAPLLETVVGLGATLRDRTASPTGATLVLEAPKSLDVRGIVEHFQSAYPGCEFVARREREHDGTPMGSPDGILDVLTARQREVLEAAYLAGYYEWPRESTAEEVADSLGIAGSTFHAHLRKAEARILSSLMDEV